jgi:succinate-semialdehyde dehydrogenase / glutarate-semialdehyde dehydrogenase
MASAPPLPDAADEAPAAALEEGARSRPGPGLGVSATAPRLPAALVERLRARVVTTGRRDDAEVISPLAQQPIGAVPVCAEDDVTEAVRRARAAQVSWAARSHAERARIVRRIGDRVIARQDEVLDLIQLESGKVRAHAFEEVADVAIVAGYYARTAAPTSPPPPRGSAARAHHHQRAAPPEGRRGLHRAVELPPVDGDHRRIPALLAGNAGVLKPAQQTPFTALWIVDVAREAGLPEDVLTVVTGAARSLGEPLIDAGRLRDLHRLDRGGAHVARRPASG